MTLCKHCDPEGTVEWHTRVPVVSLSHLHTDHESGMITGPELLYRTCITSLWPADHQHCCTVRSDTRTTVWVLDKTSDQHVLS